MKAVAIAFTLLFAISGVSRAAGAEREFYRIFQPEFSSDGMVAASGTWREIPAAHADNPKTWVAPFSDSASNLMPRCSLTQQAGLKVTSVLGSFNPRITIRISSRHTLVDDVSRANVLQVMIECIQLNLKNGSFFTIRIATGEGVSRENFVGFEGSYATLKS